MSYAPAVSRALGHSHYLRRLFDSAPDVAQDILRHHDQPFTQEAMLARLQDIPAHDEDALKRALRKLRQAVMARLIVRDVGGLTDTDEVLTTISLLADVTVDTAHRHIEATLLAQYGQPIGNESQTPQSMIVVGMGKLGGYELNVSSDIDLIFLYPENGETNGSRSLSNQEFFTRLGKRLIAAIAEPTGDGFVFRVDMRLRPYGDSGPLVMNFNAFENYLLTQGREWERYAWIKGRIISGEDQGLSDIVRPFVYRKYLDYNAYGAMRDLYAQIQREVARRDMADNIKLGPGGIREIEFIAQVFQLIRGGREPRLQTRSTRTALQELANLKLLEADTVDELQQSYRFLRDLEHRLQYLDDQQTQTLPTQTEMQLKIAESMDYPGWDGFIASLNRLRNQVHRHFEQVFVLPSDDHSSHPLTSLWQDASGEPSDEQENRLAILGYHHARETARHLATLANSQRYRQLPDTNRKRFDGLIPSLIEVAAGFANPDETLVRILSLMETISRRGPYLALLNEYPQTLRRLATLYSASPWVSNYLNRHPILLDELLDARVLYAEPNWAQLATELDEKLTACGKDVEAKMDTLRHFQHAQQFRLVAQDLAGMWPLEALSDQISLLADTVLAATLKHAWLDISKRHIEVPKFTIVGYGKLGGKELGYVSDLDIIFLYDDPHPDAADLYARLARKLSTWLTATTPAGVLYDIDLRLRPDGASGLLVSTVEAFRNYQQKKAWLWEHQALTRARFVAGDVPIGDQFEKIRFEVLAAPRNREVLRQEVLGMREKMRDSHPAVDHDIKHAHGGIIDLEFLVQYLVLAHSHYFPELTGNIGNIALLGLAANADLIDRELAEAGQAAYRHYRRLQHAKRLNEVPKVEVDQTLRQHYTAVQKLWDAVFAG